MEHVLDSESRAAQQLAIGLGWFSIGLGLAELVAPRSIARLIGISPDDASESVVRALGAREIGNGVAILAQPDRAAWLWSRVGGDAIDLSYLGNALAAEENDRRRLTLAAAAVLGVTALDVICAQRLQRESARAGGLGAARGRRRVRIAQAITVNRAIEQVYQFWHDFENFPRFMRHLEAVQHLGGGRSRWRAKAPAGATVEWVAQIIEERENEYISWRSVEGSDIQNSGTVTFERAPGARGTEVHVELEYSPPAGALGRGIAWLFGEEPELQIRDDLRRFKQLLETGEIPLSDGPGLWRPAQPAADPRELKALAGVQR